MKENIYLTNLSKIKQLYASKEYESALLIVEEELSMPYTPSEYLQQFYN
jgi:hypothetical protein